MLGQSLSRMLGSGTVSKVSNCGWPWLIHSVLGVKRDPGRSCVWLSRAYGMR